MKVKAFQDGNQVDEFLFDDVRIALDCIAANIEEDIDNETTGMDYVLTDPHDEPMEWMLFATLRN